VNDGFYILLLILLDLVNKKNDEDRSDKRVIQTNICLWRDNNMSKQTTKFMKLILAAIILFVISIPLHENGHMLMLRLLGGEGYIDYGMRLGRIVIMVEPTFSYWWVPVAVAGGGLVAATMLILSYIINDIEISLVLRLTAGYQFTYSMLETLKLHSLPMDLFIGGVGLFMTAIYSEKLIKEIIK